MAILQNKIDFVALVSVENANPNGDPLNGNRPRADYNGYGEISDVCIKRKIRNRMQDLGERVFVQSAERADDGCTSLKARAEKVLNLKNATDEEVKKACQTWVDVRSFGQVFAFNNSSKKGGTSIPVRGPVSIHLAVSCSPINARTLKITKSVNNESKEGNSKGSDTMGDKHMVSYGLYKVKGSINVQLAEKTGFTEEDAELIKQCLATLFVNDSSSARPDGSMEVYRLYWWKHNCKDGQYSSAKVHHSVHVTLKEDAEGMPKSTDDYDITVEELPGLTPEIICGE